MNKENIKNILMSIRNPENEHIVNYLLGQVDMKDDKSISEIAESLGNDENIQLMICLLMGCQNIAFIYICREICIRKWLKME